jgi:hypothetical protein
VASVSQKPRQDSISRRPSGGRFPSDLQVNAQRGLQAPVSPLSVSSGSFNHPDPFATSVSPPSDFGQHFYGVQEVGRTRGPEGGYFQHMAAADGSAGGPVQFPDSVNVGTPQRHTLHDPGPVGQSRSTRQPSIDTRYDGVTWAEPVPIPLPQQLQQLSSTRDSAADKVYDSQGGPTMSGGHTTHTTEPRTSRTGGISQYEASGGLTEEEASTLPRAAARSDSVPTISHLHIPGEYPNGATAGP